MTDAVQAALFGAALGGILGMAGSIVPPLIANRRKRTAVIKALYAECLSMAAGLSNLEQEGGNPVSFSCPLHARLEKFIKILPTEIYLMAQQTRTSYGPIRQAITRANDHYPKLEDRSSAFREAEIAIFRGFRAELANEAAALAADIHDPDGLAQRINQTLVQAWKPPADEHGS